MVARTLAGANYLYASLGIIEAQEETGEGLDSVTAAYYSLGNCLDLNWFSQQINTLKPATHWQALARETFREDLDWQQRALTVGLLSSASGPSTTTQSKTGQAATVKAKNKKPDLEALLAQWLEDHQAMLLRWQNTLSEFKATGDSEFSMFSVALRELLDLAQSTVHRS